MTDLADKLAGKFIVLDGPDGSGKTTQAALLADRLAADGAVVRRVHDPGGTPVGEKVRDILLDRDSGELCPACETMLFMASRAQLVVERVRPALDDGCVVLCDRFISATVAYQGAAGVPPDAVVRVGEVAVGGLWPDLTVILDVPVSVGMRRIGVPRERLKTPEGARAAQLPLLGDRLETKGSAYHQRVRRNFLDLCRKDLYPRPVVRVDARGERDAVFARVLGELGRAFADEGGG